MPYDLNVPYREKEEAKALGARWNGHNWYCMELTPGLMRWYEGDEVPAEQEVYEDEFGNRYLSVSEVNLMITRQLEICDDLRDILVYGEVTDYSGHASRGFYYFSLIDGGVQLLCIMPESVPLRDFELENGKKVLIKGNFRYHSRTGSAKLNVIRIEEAGEGEAARQLAELKLRLENEGLFSQERKKPLPKHPVKIGIVTSEDGQAIKDIRKVATKRNPYINLVLYPVNVQGSNAVPSTIRGIRYLDSYGCDILIVGRGGGSKEDLKAYNDESLVRAIAAANTPVISAVGHEGDISLSDYAADVRAATPSEAAEIAVPDVMSDVLKVRDLRSEIDNKMNVILRQKVVLWNNLAALLSKNAPERKLQERIDRLDLIRKDLDLNMNAVSDRKVHRFEILLANLNGSSPTAKLVKGFGYISRDDRPVVNIGDLKAGDTVGIRMHDGTAEAVISKVDKKQQI